MYTTGIGGGLTFKDILKEFIKGEIMDCLSAQGVLSRLRDKRDKAKEELDRVRKRRDQRQAEVDDIDRELRQIEKWLAEYAKCKGKTDA